MYLHYIMYACAKYETYFKFNEINIKESSDELIPKYRRLREILRECYEKKLSDEEASNTYREEIGGLFYAIKCREFVCKVNRVAYLGGMKMIAGFWGNYYTIIDFEEILKLPIVQKHHPEFEKLKDPEVFHKVFPYQYHVFFGERPDQIDVSSDFIWHYGTWLKELVVTEKYEWVRGY